MSKLALAVLVCAAPAAADPVASTEQPKPAEPVEIPAPPPPPPDREKTAADVAGEPRPGKESGRLDPVDPGDSLLRRTARAVLFLPKLAVDIGFAPIRGAIWAEDRYNLDERYYQLFFNHDRTLGLYPTASYETGYGLYLGARFVDRNTFGEGEHVYAQAATGATAGETYHESFAAGVATGDRLGTHLRLAADGNFDRRPADTFYGLGNIDGMASHYRYQEERVAGSADVRVVDNIHIKATGALTDLQYSPSTTGPSADMIYGPLAGWTGVRHVYGELELRLDERKHVSRWEPADTHGTGWLATGFAGRVHRLDNGPDFWRYGIEVQKFWHLADGPRVLVTRFHAEAVSVPTDQVPFTELPTLGGGELLRGYDFQRFRDRVAALGTVEYDWDLSHFFSAAVFVDAGRVYPSLSELTVDHMRVGYGVGLELHSDHSFVFATTLASSTDGGVFLSLNLNPVFDARPRWR